ncbi:MAG: TIGR03013 family PEP-CTERM/XrtA system glycosyltransferase [Gemmatimonadetes bacterium]|nr:TIGR03013 family PEP-CTERM/XrtA system glycosyltransferase [Gemmatimonadota bacterium]
MPYIFHKYVPLRAIAFGIGEGLLIAAAVMAGYLIFAGMAVIGQLPLLLARSLLVTLVFQLCLYYFDLYEFSRKQHLYDMAMRITQAWGAGCVIIAIIYLIIPAVIISTRVFLAAFLMAYIGVVLWRAVYRLTIEHRLFTTRLLILGGGEQAERIVRKLGEIIDSGYSVNVQVGEAAPPRLVAPEAVVYTDPAELIEVVRRHHIEMVVVALDDRRGKMPIRELMDCKLAGRRIVNGITFFEGLTGTILVENVNPSWIIFSEGFQKRRRIDLIKRSMDVVLSIFGLIVSLPVTLLSALIIKLESPGPVLYRQVRVGEGGRSFELIKFRSMRRDAERDGPVWAAEHDPRVTWYGAFMRKTRIDELPQLWNVLRKDMSFVGPRPERPVFVARLQQRIPYYSLRHAVRPGVTGWAQICFPYGASEEDALRKLEFDLYYVKNMNVVMDTMIILQTIRTVLFRKGGR